MPPLIRAPCACADENGDNCVVGLRQVAAGKTADATMVEQTESRIDGGENTNGGWSAGQETKAQQNYKEGQYHENPDELLEDPSVPASIERAIEDSLDKTGRNDMEIMQAEVCGFKARRKKNTFLSPPSTILELRVHMAINVYRQRLNPYDGKRTL